MNYLNYLNSRQGLRLEYLLGLLVCLLALGFAFYLEFIKHLEPCPLCILQRVMLVLSGFLYLLGFLQGPKRWGIKIYGGLLLISTLIGLGVAARQIYIQSLPISDLSACSPGLHYLWQTLSLNQFMTNVFQGDALCAAMGPKFIIFSLSEWSALLFLLLSLLNLHLVCRDFLIGKNRETFNG